MAPIKAKLVNPTWIDLVNKCLSERIVLSEKVVYVLFIVISSLIFLHPRTEFPLFTHMREFNLTYPIPTNEKDTNQQLQVGRQVPSFLCLRDVIMLCLIPAYQELLGTYFKCKNANLNGEQKKRIHYFG